MHAATVPRLSRRGLLGAATGVGLGAVCGGWRCVAAEPATPTAVGPVVQVSRGRGLEHSQPCLASDPTDSARLLAVSRTGSLKQPSLVAAFASVDGGRTWDDVEPLPLPSGITAGLDPTVAIDAGGSGFVAALGVPDPTVAHGDLLIWSTTNGGRTFGNPVVATADQSAAQPWLAADPVAPGRLVLVWASETRGLVACRSTDGGRSFDSPRSIAPASSGAVSAPVVVAGPNGAVYVACGVATAAPGATPQSGAALDLAPISLMVVGSTDGGAGFGESVVVGPMAGTVAPAADTRIQSEPALAIDPATGDVVVAHAVFDAATAASAIAVVRSADRGHGFGRPVVVTGDSASPRTTYAQPQIAVDSAGNVAVTYLAIDSSQPQIVYDVFLTRSTDRGATFGPRQRLSNQSRGFAVIGADENGLYHWLGGDHQGLAAAGGLLHPIWPDVELGLVTTAIPFAG
jgi:hypothetical protein